MGYRSGADVNAREAMELKMTAGSEMETVGVMGKSKETADSEAEMMAGTESGADTDAGMDSESRVDRSGAVAGAEASARCTIASRLAIDGGGKSTSWSDCGNDSVSVCGGECAARDHRSGNRAGGVIGGVYRFRINSVCVCSGEQGLGAGKCAAWNCRNGNRAGGGSRVFGGGCTFGHKSGNAYGGRGSECKYSDIGSFSGAAIGMENWTLCRF